MISLTLFCLKQTCKFFISWQGYYCTLQNSYWRRLEQNYARLHGKYTNRDKVGKEWKTFLHLTVFPVP